MCLLLGVEFSFSSFLDVVENWLRIIQTPHRYDQNEHGYKIVAKYDMRDKYSYLIRDVYRYIIEERFQKQTHYDITDSILALRIMK